MKELVLTEAMMQGAEEAHELIARTLHFPDYYGKNLSALNDCLEDTDERVRFTLCCSKDSQEWFLKLCKVVRRVANENESIDFRCLCDCDRCVR